MNKESTKRNVTLKVTVINIPQKKSVGVLTIEMEIFEQNRTVDSTPGAWTLSCQIVSILIRLLLC